MSFSICSPPVDFLAVYLFGRYRTDTVLRIATTVSFIGAMFRFLALGTDQFWPILLGTFIMASASSIFLNSQIIISNKWFPDTERAIAMSVLTIAVACGHIISFALSGFAYANIDLDTLNKDELKVEVLDSTKKLILA